MKILVDADAFPAAMEKVLIKAAERVEIQVVMVANRGFLRAKSDFISSITVPPGPDQADDRIVALVCKGDLVITADIPLADRVVSKEAWALNPRGELYTEENIKQQLAMRNLMDELRTGGMISGGPAALSPKDVQNFANQLDRFLTRHYHPKR